MCDRDPLPCWSHGRVTLLGDAAHPMYPTGSNGAGQAILDPTNLAQHLSTTEPVEALRAYEQQRLPATRPAVTATRRRHGRRTRQVRSNALGRVFVPPEFVIDPSELGGHRTGPKRPHPGGGRDELTLKAESSGPHVRAQRIAARLRTDIGLRFDVALTEEGIAPPN